MKYIYILSRKTGQKDGTDGNRREKDTGDLQGALRREPRQDTCAAEGRGEMRLQAAGGPERRPADAFPPHENPVRFGSGRVPQGGQVDALLPFAGGIREGIGLP